MAAERQSFYVGVKGIIHTEEGVLILRDAQRKKWELPGGRVDQGQSMEEAFSREVEREEIQGSIVNKLGEVVHVAIGDFVVENDHRLILVFRIAEVTLPGVIELSEEHDQYAHVQRDTVSDFDLFTTDQAALERFFRD